MRIVLAVMILAIFAVLLLMLHKFFFMTTFLVIISSGLLFHKKFSTEVEAATLEDQSLKEEYAFKVKSKPIKID